MIHRTEKQRLSESDTLKKKWKKWGPYLSDRQWGTVREDYSANGNAWENITHDSARSRAFRWGEEGIGGISDERQLLCFAPSFWNGKDPILKERLFGLNNSEGNHGAVGGSKADDNETDATVVKTAINLAHSLGLRVTAEGVESNEVLAKLKAYGCDMAQGYFLNKPLSVINFTQWMNDFELQN